MNLGSGEDVLVITSCAASSATSVSSRIFKDATLCQETKGTSFYWCAFDERS
jgi:hypothetical protein